MEHLLMIPGPTNVHPRVLNAMSKPMINHRGPEFHELYGRLINNLKYVFQTKGDIFILSCSGTGGIEAAINNVIKPGDKVIVPTYGFFCQGLKTIIRSHGGIPIELPIELGKAVTAEKLEEILKEEPKAKLIAIVHNETSTGAKVPDLEKIGRLAREYGALLLIDAISSLGGDELKLDEWNIDLCVAGSQKCLAAPPGLALLSVSDKAWNIINENPDRDYYFDLLKYKEFLEQRLETPYTPAIPLFYALDEAIKMIIEEGLDNRIKRHEKCAKAFYSAFKAMGLEIFPAEEFRSQTVIALKLPDGINGDELRKVVKNKFNISIAGSKIEELKGKLVRIGSMGLISKKEVMNTINALGKSLAYLGKQVNLKQALDVAGGEL